MKNARPLRWRSAQQPTVDYYCGVIEKVPLDALQVWLAGLLYVPDKVVVFVARLPCIVMTVSVVSSVTVMVKLLPLVVAVARNAELLIHMLVGTGTEPL